MADEPTGPTEPPATPPPPAEPERAASSVWDVPLGSHFQHIEAFIEMRAELYMSQAAVLVVRKGNVDEARRQFMKLAVDTFDDVATNYTARSLNWRMKDLQARRRAEREREQPAEPPPDPASQG